MDVARLDSKCVSRNKNQDKSGNIFQSRTIVCYTRERVKRKEKENPPAPTTSLYIALRQLPSNHPSCFDVVSKFSFMILHSLRYVLMNTTMPQHLTSQHFLPHPHLILISPHYSHTITSSLSPSRTFVPTSAKWMTSFPLVPAPLSSDRK